MKFQAQPSPARHDAVQSVPSPATPVVPSAATVPAAPNVHIDRLEFEGCGPVSAAAVRAGFREAWLRSSHAKKSWSAGSGTHFDAPLGLNLPPGPSGREVGRRLAEAILQRAEARGRRDGVR